MVQLAWLIAWLPLLGFFHNAVAGYLYKDLATRKRVVSWVAPGVVLAAFVVAVLVLLEVQGKPGHRAYASLIPFGSPNAPWIWMGEFRVNFGLLLDPLSMLMALIVTGVGGLIHVYATGYMADDREQPRFFTYFNLFIFMMLLLVLGDNFLLMFVGWEGVGSCSYLLISFWYTQTENAKAGNKAFIVNRIGDLGFVLGMSAVWALFGTLTFREPDGTGVLDLAVKGIDAIGSPLSNHMVGTMPLLSLACILLFVGAMGKSAQIPLWTWLPDAMAGPTPVSALIHAATMVTAGVVMLTRCSFLFVQAPEALALVALVGVLTAFMGATIGLVQNDIKRVLAFSTVSQLGYMFLACGAGNFVAGMFHVTTHAFFKALLFLGSGAVIHSMLGEQDMRRMGGLAKYIKATCAVMWVGTLAIAAIPPLSGIWSKDEILEAASEIPGVGPLYWGIGTLTALMTAFYMGRMMMKTFYGKEQFENGKLVAHHHSNFDDEEAHGHGHDAHATAAHDPANPADDHHTGVEETTHTQGQAHADAGHGHGHGHGAGSVHESPKSMMFPLYVLAFLSAVFGVLVGHMTGDSRFEHFLQPSVAPRVEHVGSTHLFANPWYGVFVSALVGAIGLFGAYTAYRAHAQTNLLVPERQKARNPVYQFLANKWWWDAAYNKLFIDMGGKFADRFLWRLVDAKLIDGAVNGAAGVVGQASLLTRRLQTGYVRNYALAMLLGVVLLAFVLLQPFWR